MFALCFRQWRRCRQRVDRLARRAQVRPEAKQRPLFSWIRNDILRTLLLVSAAGIVAVATAQAADLPTRKAAPVEYVRVCNVGGITGWTLPGSDTCVKFSGYITAQFKGGNLNTQYNWASTSILEGITGVPPLPFGQGLSTQRVLVAASAGSREHNFLSSRDRLVDPRQFRRSTWPPTPPMGR